MSIGSPLRFSYPDVGFDDKYWIDSIDPLSTLHWFMPVGLADFLFDQQERADYSRQLDHSALAHAIQASGLPFSPSQQLALEKLKDPSSRVVVTGQQPGSIGGPLYIFNKIITSIVLAEKLEQQMDVPVIPILWDGGEDHDIAKEDHFGFWDTEGMFKYFSFSFPSGSLQPMWSISLPVNGYQDFAAFINNNYPLTDHCRNALNWLESLWKKSTTWSDLFDQFWLEIFHNSPLLVIRPWEPSFKRLAISLFQKEIEDPAGYRKYMEADSRHLEAEGYSPRVHKKEGVCSFFLMENGLRNPVTWDDGRFQVDGRSYSGSELIKVVEEKPEIFSPNALLRPLYQDTILPTIASVLGPGEIAYQAQLSTFYQRRMLPRPALVNRFSLSILPSRSLIQLQELGLTIPDLLKDEQELAKQCIQVEWNSDLETQGKQLRASLGNWQMSLQKLTELHQLQTGPILQSNTQKIQELISHIEDLFRREGIRKDQTTLKRIRKIKNQLFPDGVLQERKLGLFPFLIRFGNAWIEELLQESIQWDGKDHYIIPLEGGMS